MSQAYTPDSTKPSAKKPSAAPSNPPKSKTLLRLLKYLKPYWWALLLTVLGFAINAGTEIWIAKLLQYITDAINQSDRSKQSVAKPTNTVLDILIDAVKFYFLAD